MESRQYRYHRRHHQGTGMDETVKSTNYNGTSGKSPSYQNGTSKHHIASPDVIEKDSRNVGVSADIHYPPSMMAHDDIATKQRPVFLLARSPILDNEKDMTRTPTTPRSPPAPISASPATTSSDSHDGKIPPGIGGGGAIASSSGVSSVGPGGGVLPRGAHLPSYRSSTTSSTMSSSSSSSLTSAGSEPGSNGGYVGGSGHGARPPSHHQLRTQYTTTTTGGHKFRNSYGSSNTSGGQLQGQQGMGGGGGGMSHLSHMQQQSDSRYRVGSGGQYDTRYTNRSRPPLAAAGMYNQPAQAYSTYPSESYAPPYHRANYSRPLSTGSLSSVSTASSRPGFSSLDEFPTMNDHRSTFAPSVGRPPQHRNSAGALPYNYGGGGGGGGGEFRHYHSHPYRQIHDHPSSNSGGYVEGGPGAGASSPLSPLSYDEHQPLLSLSLSEQPRQQQQTSSVVLCGGESPSDELGGQTISEEMSRMLNIQDYRTSSQQASGQPHARMQSSMATGGSSDEGASCILILEHPRDVEACLNEKAVLRCTARISRCDQGRSQSKAERVDDEEEQGEGEEEPNLLWYKDAEPLIGEIDCEFVVEKVTEKDMGAYYCLVSHPTQEHLQRQSNVARLTIKKDQDGGGGHGVGESSEAEGEARRSAPPEIVEQPPKEMAAVISEKLLIPLKATGAQLSFRWYKDNKELRYADGPVLQIPSAHYSDSGVYCCSVSNQFGSVLSNNSLVKVTQVRDSSAAQSQPGFNKRPTSLYDWGDQPLSDAFLRDVGKAVAHQTTNLNRIAYYLGLRNPDIVEINQHFRKPEEQVFHMLRLWSRVQGRERRTLKIILTKAGIKLDLLTAGASRKQTVKPPKIAVHPKSTRVTYGHSLNLSVQADPSEPGFTLQYQWYRNGKSLGGKTDPNIIISSATNGDAGEYYCVVSNQSERTVSQVAGVDVINPHSSASMAAAASSAFIHPLSSTTSTGAPHPTYLKGHWGRGGLSGEPPSRHDNQCCQAPPTMGGDFLSRGGVRDVEGGEAGDQPSGQPLSMGGVDSRDRQPRDTYTEATEKAGARIFPSQQQQQQPKPPQVVEHPQSQQVEAGDPLTLRCSAIGGGGEQLGYTWYFNGLSLAGEDRPEYEINCFTDEDEGLYQCKVQSAHGEALSRMAHIQMKDDASD